MNETSAPIGSECLQSFLKWFSYYKKLSEQAIDQLEDADLTWKPEQESNSIAIIVQHLSGNMVSRWTDMLSSDGEKPWRNRDKEFDDPIGTLSETRQLLAKGWACLFEGLKPIRHEDLCKTILIRNQPHTVLDAINRQLGHCSYHVGQIVYLAKARKGSKWHSLSVPKGKSAEFNKDMFTQKQQ
jgi:hypothetical protein